MILKLHVQSLQGKLDDRSEIVCAEGSVPDTIVGRKVGFVMLYNVR